MSRKHRRPIATATAGTAAARLESLEPRQLFAAGDLDQNFGAAGFITHDVAADSAALDRATAVVTRPNNQLFVGGSINSTAYNGAYLALFDSSAGLVTGFATGGRVLVNNLFPAFGPAVVSMAQQPDGKLLLLGNSPANDVVVARFNPDGSPDAAFGNSGLATVDVNNAGAASVDVGVSVLVDGDGRVYVAGSYRQSVASPDEQFFAARLTPTGTIDTTYGGGDGVGLLGFNGTEFIPVEARLDSGDRLVVAGFVDGALSGNTIDPVIARFTAAGVPDPSFHNADGYHIIPLGAGTQQATALDLLPDGSPTIAGFDFQAGSAFFARLRADGGPEGGFGDGGIAYDSGTTSIPSDLGVLSPLGDFVVLANASGSSVNITRYSNGGFVDASFGSNGRVNITHPSASAAAIDLLHLQPPAGSSPSAILAGSVNSPSDTTLARVLDLQGGSTFNGFTLAPLEPRLLASEPVAPGATGTLLNFALRNQGNQAVNGANVAVDLFLSANDTIGDSDDIFLRTVNSNVSTIADSVVGFGPLDFTVPANVPEGAYRLGATLAPVPGDAFETSRSVLSYHTFKIASASADFDLSFRTPVPSPTSVAPGANFNITNLGVINGGSSPFEGSFTYDAFLSLDGQIGNADDVPLFSGAQVSNVTINPGATLTLSNVQATVPANAPAGSYFLGLLLNPVAGETSTLNNSSFSVQRVAVTGAGGAADLVVNNVTADTPLTPGGFISVNVIASNTGGTAVDSVAAALFLSTDDVYGNADDIPIGAAVGSLPAGATNVSLPGTVAVPATVTPGQYRLLVVIDPGNQVAESNENNNVFTGEGPINIGASTLPNLTPSVPTASTSTAKPGSSITVSTTVTNNGASASAPTTVFFILASSTTNPDPGNIPVFGQVDLPAIQPGGSAQVSTTFTIPANFPTGTYFLAAFVDPAQAVTESNEIDNITYTGAPVFNVGAPPPIRVGGLNPNFGTGGVRSSPIAGPAFNTVDSAVQPDGKVVVAGSTRNGQQFVLTRFNADGSLDTSFGTAGVVRTALGQGTADIATSVAIQPDGKILLAGSSNGDFVLLRFNADGSVDNSFGTNGVVLTDLAALRGIAGGSADVANAIAVVNNGLIYVAGTTTPAGSPGDFAVVRFNAAGQLDTSFGTGGVATADFAGGADAANAIVIQSDGRIAVAGSATNPGNGVVQIAVARFLPSGQPDTSFNRTGKLAFTSLGNDNEIFAIRQQRDGKLVIGGFYSEGSLATGDFETNFYLARLLPNGRFDTKFGTRGQVRTNLESFGYQFTSINDLVITPEGKILVAGKTARNVGDVADANLGVALARYTDKGVLDRTFSDDGILIVFEPGSVPATAPSAPGDTQDQFNQFTAASVGVVELTPGGGILTLASQPAQTGGTVVSLAAVVPDGPDLSATTLVFAKTPASVLQGAKGQVSLTLRNAGSLPLKGRVPVTLRLSTDTTPDDTDNAFRTMNVSVNLKPGQSKRFTLKFNFPASIAPGDYFVLATATPAASLRDLDPNNNDAAVTRQTTITPRPARGSARATAAATFANPIPAPTTTNDEDDTTLFSTTPILT